MIRFRSRHLIVLIGMLSALACGGMDAARSGGTTTADSAGVGIVSHSIDASVPVCSIDPSSKPVIGHSGEYSELDLGPIFNAVSLTDGKIALINGATSSLRIYDTLGSRVYDSGRTGEGPGEFRTPFRVFGLDNDTIFVADFAPWRLLVRSPDGQWIRTVDMTPMRFNPPEDIVVLADGSLIFADLVRGAAIDTRIASRQLVLTRHDPMGVFKDTIGAFPADRVVLPPQGSQWRSVPPVFEPTAFIASDGSSLYVGSGNKPEIRAYSPDPALELRQIIRWSASPVAVTSADIEQERARINALYEDTPPAQRVRMLEPLVDPARPHAEYHPIFDALIVTKGGNAWVREGTANKSSQDKWLRLSATHDSVCRFSVPDDSRILHISDEAILLLIQDELGQESVVRRRVLN